MAVIQIENLTEMLKGILEGCILEIISRKETYGYEILDKLHAMGFEDIVVGTVYTILLRLEKNKTVDICKRASEIGPERKYYSLNKSGEKELSQFWDRWHYVSWKINELESNNYV